MILLWNYILEFTNLNIAGYRARAVWIRIRVIRAEDCWSATCTGLYTSYLSTYMSSGHSGRGVYNKINFMYSCLRFRTLDAQTQPVFQALYLLPPSVHTDIHTYLCQNINVSLPSFIIPHYLHIMHPRLLQDLLEHVAFLSYHLTYN